MRTVTIALAALTTLSLCGCNYARLTHLHSVTPQVAALGEPGLVASGWGLPPADGRGYAVYTHDPAVNNGCSEWDVEPAAELDNDGQLCKSVLP